MEEAVKVETVETNYLGQIAQLKEAMDTMVPGDEYNKLVQEHKRLTDEYINKRAPAEEAPIETKPASYYAAKLMKNEKMTNLEFVKNSLDYRDAYIREVGKDPWANELAEGGSTVEDANSVANHLSTLVEEFGDDPSEFNFRFEQSLVDDPLLVAKLKNKKR